MYLSSLRIENFRTFGSSADNRDVTLTFSAGFNLLVGENDAGKTTIVDAIRHLLWTTSQDYHRLSVDDFHVSGSNRATNLTISAVFRDLSLSEQAAFLEYLTTDDGEPPRLCVTLAGSRPEVEVVGAAKPRIGVTFRSGATGTGPAIEGALREFLRVTYLRPLRDAEAELTAGRSSRLSQILASHPEFYGQAVSDYTPGGAPPTTLVGIMAQAEALIQANAVVTGVRNDINNRFLADLSLGEEPLAAAITVARRTDLQQILEKLELALGSSPGIGLPTRRGLGLNNVLFMATELLLLGASDGMPLLLVEEPEAHLHPQMQLRLMELLELRSRSGAGRVQVLATTHSPNLASKADIETITVLAGRKAFALNKASTQLEPSDYAFLRRFLDVTKANLFFARAVLIVEGEAENILLPAIAEVLGRPLSKYGVSIVNVGHRGLFRYARIFQRADGSVMPIKVACLADRDVPTQSSRAYVPEPEVKEDAAPRKKFDDEFSAAELAALTARLQARDHGAVRTFVSPSWTLEHDLARHGLAKEMHRAVRQAQRTKSKGDVLDDAEILTQIAAADLQFGQWGADGSSAEAVAADIYKPLFKNQASKVETAQFMVTELLGAALAPVALRERLPSYIIEAIEYLTAPLVAADQAV